jgi:hypothetical protein
MLARKLTEVMADGRDKIAIFYDRPWAVAAADFVPGDRGRERR